MKKLVWSEGGGRATNYKGVWREGSSSGQLAMKTGEDMEKNIKEIRKNTIVREET